jgi:hypothetical protein
MIYLCSPSPHNIALQPVSKTHRQQQLDASLSNMAPYSVIPDLNESSSRGTSSSLNNKTTCTSRQLPNPKRSITFSHFATIHNVLHINDYSGEEIECTRYYADELKEIKKTDVLNTLSMMKGGLHIREENPWYCCRGLEPFTREGSARRKANRENAWNAVFWEQDLQWENGIYDPEAISNAYSEFSHDCQDAAVMKATEDHDMSRETSFELLKPFACGCSARIAPQRLDDDCGCHEISGKAA